jgi:hypothetical protein
MIKRRPDRGKTDEVAIMVFREEIAEENWATCWAGSVKVRTVTRSS